MPGGPDTHTEWRQPDHNLFSGAYGEVAERLFSILTWAVPTMPRQTTALWFDRAVLPAILL